MRAQIYTLYNIYHIIAKQRNHLTPWEVDNLRYLARASLWSISKTHKFTYALNLSFVTLIFIRKDMAFLVT